MAIRVNPKLIDDLEKYGAEDVQNCYHCGNCSAVCPHADDVFVFPRKPMRHLQMGLEKKLEQALEPWMCYYCGQCSEQCPRGAEPGETMMSLRRWLISRYDFTGLSRLFFRSTQAEIVAVLLVALLTGAGALLYGFRRGDIRVYSGAGAFLPSSFIHVLDLGIALVIFAVLAINVFRFWRSSLAGSGALSMPWWLYLKKLYLLPWHFFTQKRYAECDNNRLQSIYPPWLFHLGIVAGYVTMLVLVMVFLDSLQAGPDIQWSVHAFGYLAGIGLLAGSVYMLRLRLTKARVQYQRSHGSDWIFLVMLFLMALTGMVQHLLHRSGWLVAANITYVIHLMIVVPWLLRMPFTKWSHILYRPLAMFFAGVRKAALQHQAKTGMPVGQMRQAA